MEACDTIHLDQNSDDNTTATGGSSTDIQFLDTIDESISIKGNSAEALERILLFFLDVDVRTPINQIQRVYSYLHNIIPFLDKGEMEKLREDVFPKLQYFPILHQEQMQLAVEIAEWHLMVSSSVPLEQLLTQYLQSMHYYSKAILIAELNDSSQLELLRFGISKVFMRVIKDQSTFRDRLDRARREVDPDKFGRVLAEIEILKQYRCDHEDHTFLKGLIEQAGRILANITLKNQEKFKCFSPFVRQKLIEKFDATDINHTTQGYRNAIQNFRGIFRKEIDDFSSELNDFNAVRKSQQIIQDHFLRFFQEKLVEHVFAFIGPPPCAYDLRAMGSIGRGELCPYSDLEWMILIEDEKHFDYFQKLAQIIKLQIVSLGETAASNLPVFSCLGDKHKSGFHVDSGSDPVDATLELIRTPQAMACKQKAWDGEKEHSDACLPVHTLRKSCSLLSDHSFLFTEYENEMEKILSLPLPEGEQILLGKTIGQRRALGLLGEQLKAYGECFKTPPEKQTVLDIKEQFIQLINYCLNDLALYYNIREVNTLDIIDALVEKEVFTER
ncbi:MAG: hypothetical protein K940chlam7_01383, partial [Chlamydiae bacterium]|nr:hypothetical protein [Chlamydiota bacterium]